MRSFEFRRQLGLEVRRQQADVEIARLEKLTGQAQRLEDEQTWLLNQSVEARQELRAAAGIRGEDLMALSHFERYVESRSTTLRAERSKLQPHIDRQRTVVMDAERKVRLLEKLKERRIQEWKTACDCELEQLASESYLARLLARRRLTDSSANATLYPLPMEPMKTAVSLAGDCCSRPSTSGIGPERESGR